LRLNASVAESRGWGLLRYGLKNVTEMFISGQPRGAVRFFSLHKIYDQCVHFYSGRKHETALPLVDLGGTIRIPSDLLRWALGVPKPRFIFGRSKLVIQYHKHAWCCPSCENWNKVSRSKPGSHRRPCRKCGKTVMVVVGYREVSRTERQIVAMPLEIG